MSVGDLGDRLRLDSGTLTPLLTRLEAAGLVSRLRDPADERRVLVYVTAAGDALQDEPAPARKRVVEGQRVSVRLGLGSPLFIKTKSMRNITFTIDQNTTE